MSDEKVAKLSIKREEGFSYWIKAGAVWRKPDGGAGEKVAETGIAEDRAYLYFLDSDGDVSRRPRGSAPQPATSSGSPVSFADAFVPLREHAGKKVKLELRGKKRPITIFDWSKLNGDARASFAESQILELKTALGKGWDKKQVPFALVGGESHPVPLDELDQQADGVLLIDLASGAVLYCDDPSSSTAKKIADATRALAIGK